VSANQKCARDLAAHYTPSIRRESRAQSQKLRITQPLEGSARDRVEPHELLFARLRTPQPDNVVFEIYVRPQ
jgi:hypothetical protein